MVQFSTLMAGFAATLAVSAAPLTIPFGRDGQLTIDENGESITIGGTTITLGQVMASMAGSSSQDCSAQGTPPPPPPPPASTTDTTSTNAKAVYFITNAEKNSVVALKVNDDGTLADGSITSTGGAGMSGIQDGKPAAPDALFSQGAVKTSGNSLVAVNPGSNTISMFNIDPNDATNLTMVGKPVDTLGEFPISVTLSSKLGQACVANGGAKAGVACFSMCAENGLTALDTSLRAFDIKQKTPPTGPANTVSQIFFNEDSSALLTTVKGDPAVNNTGFISVFPVVDSVVSTKDVRSSPSGTALLFGTALVPGSNNVFVTDAAFGSVTLAISPNGNVGGKADKAAAAADVASTVATTKIDNQKATCWATISDVTKTAFVTDVGVNQLVEIDPASGDLIKSLASTNGNPGMIDLVSAGNFIYALSPGNGTTKPAVTVFDVSEGSGKAKEIQNFEPQGVTESAQGMTFA